METNYKSTVSGSIGAGISAVFHGSDRRYFILEHKTQSAFHQMGENQKIIVDQVELGRASTCQVRFDESFDTVSRRHAAIVKDGDGWKIISLSQTNHTYVNGTPVTEARLNNGDEIRLSSNGPLLGFIVPQGARSMVNSIGLTERMNLFRKQALRPYKTAIAVLAILLLVGIGTLSFFNIKTNKELNEQIKITNDFQNQLVADAEKLHGFEGEMLEKDAQIKHLQEMAASEKTMTAEQMANNERRLAALMAERNEVARQYNDIRNHMVEIEQNLYDIGQSSPDVVVPASMEQNVTEPAVAASRNQKFSSIDECIPAIYHISMDKITVYDRNRTQLYQFDTKDNITGGTGFLLDNGTFVTARRVVQPWFYYRGTVFGSTSIKGKKFTEWTGWRLYWAWSAGMNVVAEFTARNSEGNSFKFLSSEVSHTKDYEVNVTSEIYQRGIGVKSPYDLVRLVNRFESKEYIVSTADKNDWASIPEVAALAHSNGGLVSDPGYSAAPQKDEVRILGFPMNEGAASSFDIKPIEEKNSINTPDLNRNGLIELSTKRFVPGNDGSPILTQINGTWTVIGVLCHSDNDNRDLAVPIMNVKRK